MSGFLILGGGLILAVSHGCSKAEFSGTGGVSSDGKAKAVVVQSKEELPPSEPQLDTITTEIMAAASDQVNLIASPKSGKFFSTVTVKLQSTTDGAKIYYNVNDNDDPICGLGKLYNGDIVVNEDSTIKAVACKDGLIPSQVNVRKYIKYPNRCGETGNSCYNLPFLNLITSDLTFYLNSFDSFRLANERLAENYDNKPLIPIYYTKADPSCSQEPCFRVWVFRKPLSPSYPLDHQYGQQLLRPSGLGWEKRDNEPKQSVSGIYLLDTYTPDPNGDWNAPFGTKYAKYIAGVACVPYAESGRWGFDERAKNRCLFYSKPQELLPSDIETPQHGSSLWYSGAGVNKVCGRIHMRAPTLYETRSKIPTGPVLWNLNFEFWKFTFAGNNGIPGPTVTQSTAFFRVIDDSTLGYWVVDANGVPHTSATYKEVKTVTCVMPETAF